jgi:PAS domain S-box-containing protein
MEPESRPGLRAIGRAIVPGPVRLAPIRRRDFWAVQGLVFVIAGTHTLLETAGRVEFPPELYLIPTSLFFVPVVYAAVRFGARGSITTALWSIALTVPNIIFLHSGLDRVGIIWQLGILLAIGAFVGVRVDRERLARAETEARERERRASEEHYRALFDGAAEAILVIGTDSRIEEANAAAGALLGHATATLKGMRVSEAAGPAVATALGDGGAPASPVALPSRADGQLRWVQPVSSGPLTTADGRTHLHAMLRDVTLQHERQQGLEQYARRTVTAREEERRRIGRELHDGALQSLVLVGRKLDAIGDTGPPAPTMQAVEEARDVVDGTAADLRRLSRALRPSILDDLGLIPALRSEVAAVGRRSGLATRFGTLGSPVDLSPDLELLFLRIAQEALHNVEKHADASLVAVRLAFGRDCACLVVRDDGRGPGAIPSAAALLANGRLGLVGMEERTRLAGGEFQVRVRPRGGTSIAVRVPLAAAIAA